MNCAYHNQNVAVVNCNGCAKPLCPACDHRIKGFPYCQDCIVLGVDLLRQQGRTNYAPFVKKRTSPVIATLLSFICPGLGAAYNGQTTKALVHFAVFVGLFQLAALTGGTPIFVLGFIGMWFFAALDSWRSAQMIRSGVTPDTAEDILVRRFSGNTKLWWRFGRSWSRFSAPAVWYRSAVHFPRAFAAAADRTGHLPAARVYLQAKVGQRKLAGRQRPQCFAEFCTQ